MDDYLIAFKNKLLSAEKGVESIGMEQAQQDLCNLLNFDFGDANQPTDTYQYDTIHVKLAVNGSQVDLAQLASAYINAQQQIIESYKKVELTDKSVYTIVCSFNSVENRDGNTDVEIVITYRGYIGQRNYIHDTLDWRPTRLGGTCNGLYVGLSGGPIIMEQWLREDQLIPECENGGRVYLTNHGTHLIIGLDTYDEIAERFKVYASYVQNQNTVCIPHEDMEYYFANILDYWDYELPSTNIAISILVDILQISQHGAYYINHEQYIGWWTWFVSISHAKPNCSGTDPIV